MNKLKINFTNETLADDLNDIVNKCNEMAKYVGVQGLNLNFQSGDTLCAGLLNQIVDFLNELVEYINNNQGSITEEDDDYELVLDYDRYPISYKGGTLQITAYIAKNGRKYSNAVTVSNISTSLLNKYLRISYEKYSIININIPENLDEEYKSKSYIVTFHPLLDGIPDKTITIIQESRNLSSATLDPTYQLQIDNQNVTIGYSDTSFTVKVRPTINNELLTEGITYNLELDPNNTEYPIEGLQFKNKSQNGNWIDYNFECSANTGYTDRSHLIKITFNGITKTVQVYLTKQAASRRAGVEDGVNVQAYSLRTDLNATDTTIEVTTDVLINGESTPNNAVVEVLNENKEVISTTNVSAGKKVTKLSIPENTSESDKLINVRATYEYNNQTYVSDILTFTLKAKSKYSVTVTPNVLHLNVNGESAKVVFHLNGWVYPTAWKLWGYKITTTCGIDTIDREIKPSITPGTLTYTWNWSVNGYEGTVSLNVITHSADDPVGNLRTIDYWDWTEGVHYYDNPTAIHLGTSYYYVGDHIDWMTEEEAKRILLEHGRDYTGYKLWGWDRHLIFDTMPKNSFYVKALWMLESDLDAPLPEWDPVYVLSNDEVYPFSDYDGGADKIEFEDIPNDVILEILTLLSTSIESLFSEATQITHGYGKYFENDSNFGVHIEISNRRDWEKITVYLKIDNEWVLFDSYERQEGGTKNHKILYFYSNDYPTVIVVKTKSDIMEHYSQTIYTDIMGKAAGYIGSVDEPISSIDRQNGFSDITSDTLVAKVVPSGLFDSELEYAINHVSIDSNWVHVYKFYSRGVSYSPRFVVTVDPWTDKINALKSGASANSVSSSYVTNVVNSSDSRTSIVTINGPDGSSSKLTIVLKCNYGLSLSTSIDPRDGGTSHSYKIIPENISKGVIQYIDVYGPSGTSITYHNTYHWTEFSPNPAIHYLVARPYSEVKGITGLPDCVITDGPNGDLPSGYVLLDRKDQAEFNTIRGN